MPTLAANPVRLLAVAFAALGCALLSDRPAVAGCGDYLTIRPAKPPAEPAPKADGHGQHQPAKAPCRGPHCSANRLPDQPPLGPLPFKVSAPDTDPAVLGRQPDAPSVSSAGWPVGENRRVPISRPFAPFHPPKSA